MNPRTSVTRALPLAELEKDTMATFSKEVQQELESIYAFKHNSSYYCPDCFSRVVLQDEYEQFPGRVQREMLQAVHGDLLNVEVIHENTVQFEQFPGDIIPLKGIYCVSCESELYAPYDTGE